MKSHIITKSLLTLAITAALGLGSAHAKDKKADEAALEAKAKVTKAEAEKTALAKVPGGTVKKSEIEDENGVLVWSFDITVAGAKDETEVTVDATTGKVVKVEKESDDKNEKGEKEDKD